MERLFSRANKGHYVPYVYIQPRMTMVVYVSPLPPADLGQSTGEQFLMKEGLSPAEGPEDTFVKVDTLGEAVKAVQMFGEKKILVMLRGGQILLLRKFKYFQQ